MLGQMFGGGGMQMGGQQQEQDMTQWPKSENPAVEPQYEFLVNTEWKGKTSKYMLMRDGIVESSLKECEHEGMCLWAANNGKIMINTPTLKVVKFVLLGFDTADKKKLDQKDEAELKKLTLESEKAAKTGKKSQLLFDKLATADEQSSIPSKDLYKVLDCKEDATEKEIKSKYRKASVLHHPDKGGKVEVFNEIRDAYEILSDATKRAYYDLGGAQLVQNADNLAKEAEGQKAQMTAQLDQVPKNHPQRAMFEAQIAQQTAQFDQKNMKHEAEKKLRNDDMDVNVPISAVELYNGANKKTFEFKRLIICRGCKVDPTAPECQDCGRCPPEKVQIPKYANTPFGKQVVGVKEKEQESLERCREFAVSVDMKVPKAAKEGYILKTVKDIGHQVPGKIPGRVVFRVQRGSPSDAYTIAENDLHTVLHMTLQQALFGFAFSWTHLGDETVNISREKVTNPNEVVRVPKKGLGAGSTRGDLFVRLAIDMPTLDKGAKTLSLEAPATKEKTQPQLVKESEVEIKDGGTWRRWHSRENALKKGSEL